jgi:chloramphenicol O-acetyltransferase
MSVPIKFQSLLKIREFTQTLHTQNYTDAVPAAYKLAGEAKTLFSILDSAMTGSDYDDDFLRSVIDEIEKEEGANNKSLSEC